MRLLSESVIQPLPPNDGRDWDCQCARCGSSADWRECDMCGGDGVDGHDCGEDCCMCRYPEDNVRCDYCRGYGGDYSCMSSPEYCEENPLVGRGEVERGKIEWFTFEEKR